MINFDISASAAEYFSSDEAVRNGGAFTLTLPLVLDGIGTLEHLASVVVAVLAIIVLVRLSARIYSGGLLRFGRRVKLREAWRSAEL